MSPYLLPPSPPFRTQTLHTVNLIKLTISRLTLPLLTQAIRKRRFRYSADRINLLNQIAIRELRGTGVTIWDSTLPLSIQYTDACLKKSRSTPPLFKWKCRDVGHLGYIFVEQLADMLYNSVCNRYLNLGEGYCGHDTSS